MPCCSQKARTVAATVLLGSFLAGCSDLYYDRRETVTFAASDALASAQATQTIDPWPPASANRKIIQPRGMSTSAGYTAPAQSQQGGGGPSASAASSSAK